MSRISPRLRRALVWGAIAVGAYVLVCVGVVAFATVKTRSGQDQLEALRESVTPQELLDGSALGRIEGARADFDTAHDWLSSPLLAPVRVLPVVGRQVRTYRALTGSAARVMDIGVEAAEAARTELNRPIPPGQARIDTLRSLADIAEATSARVAVVDLGPGDALISPVRSARADFEDDKIALELALLHTRDAARALADLFEGPSSYLLFAANNAEMRAGQGMDLSVGILSFEDGQVSLGEMQPTGDLLLNEPGVRFTDRTYEARWGYTHPNREWRNLAMTPRFPASAEMATRMWESLGRPPVDGVIAVDVIALEALLGATGPVQVDDTEVTADNVVQALLHDQYYDTEDQEARRDRMAAVARAVITRFDTSDPDLPELASGLQDAVAGRHLMLWSHRPRIERAWDAAGVGGSIGPDSLMVGLLNQGANKLDQFVRLRGRIEVAPGDDGTEVTVEIRARNRTPEGEPAYVSGTDTELTGGYGYYLGTLALWMPLEAEVRRPEGLGIVAEGRDGRSQVVAGQVRIPPGETVTWTVNFTLPAEADHLTVESSARVPTTEWDDGELVWNDGDQPQRTVEW